MNTIAPTQRTTLIRRPERGAYDRSIVNAILDEALICHVGFAIDGQPFVLPTTHARVDDQLYIHGSVGGRMLKTLRRGAPVCVTVTLIDGLVLARSAFHHSMNYRSVVILGGAREVADEAEKRRAFSALVDHVLAGRSTQTREASPQELKATSVLCVPIEEASAKVRTGPPIDDEADYALPYWAGVLPVRLQAQPPVADPRLPAGIPLPASLLDYRRA
ncbi:MAG TPA: pyridoxamine 5'-phosphate oxidase family protein [Steroidobacteraceae bacterium]|nr:pyridoxamine 5'-phosphate oxidase family protein [Steroidobacteraceae bacterium]